MRKHQTWCKNAFGSADLAPFQCDGGTSHVNIGGTTRGVMNRIHGIFAGAEDAAFLIAYAKGLLDNEQCVRRMSCDAFF
ncbi:hypothetical protein P3T43_002770 [Paraburkholderia sp. GAS41]|jgi:hypothetical protein